jgi:hypothetical protein
MSQAREVVDLVKRTGGGEPEQRPLDLLAPEVKVDLSRRIFNPDIYEGHAELPRFRREREQVREKFSVTGANR